MTNASNTSGCTVDDGYVPGSVAGCILVTAFGIPIRLSSNALDLPDRAGRQSSVGLNDSGDLDALLSMFICLVIRCPVVTLTFRCV